MLGLRWFFEHSQIDLAGEVGKWQSKCKSPEYDVNVFYLLQLFA